MNAVNKEQPHESNLLPFWKEKSFILWVLPLVGSALAIFLDYGYLQYFDIPGMYAEINFYTASLISFFLALTFIGVIFITMLADKLSKSNIVIFKLLLQPVPIFLCLLFLFIATISNQSRALIVVVYLLCVGAPLVSAIFNRSKDKTFRMKLDFAIESMFASSKKEVNTSSKTHEKGAIVFLIISSVLIILVACEYIAKNLDVWVLSKNQSMIAIKRNNDIYILKPFDRQTMILGPGFEIIKIGENPLALELMQPKGELKTQKDFDYDKSEKDRKLQDQKNVERIVTNIINSVRRYMGIVKTWLNGN